jgi:hypothetical protein
MLTQNLIYIFYILFQIWEVGDPTVLKHSKNFRQLLAWDFTQFSCFNQIDSLLLVSSVKTTTDYMERRGYVAIISLLNGIITIVIFISIYNKSKMLLSYSHFPI